MVISPYALPPVNWHVGHNAGIQRPLPDGYEGFILKPCKSATAATDTEQRSWQVTGSFQQVIVWNHDTVPVSTDWHHRCLDWLLLADKVRPASCIAAAALSEGLK
jgi:hypothetical protein